MGGEKKRGPKQGIKHQPGRGHDRKSAAAKKKRFARKAAEKRKRATDDVKKAWAEWDALPDEAKRLLGPRGSPICRGRKMTKTRRTNSDPQEHGNDVERLYLKLLRVFYEKPNQKQAEAVAAELEQVLAARQDVQDSIRGEEIRSLLAEVRGDLASAARSREAEIRKILELHSVAANTPGWPHVIRQYGYSDISDRLDLLAALYDKQGDTDRAIATLQESKQWCQSHQVAFDGQDLLDELLGQGNVVRRSKRRETA